MMSNSYKDLPDAPWIRMAEKYGIPDDEPDFWTRQEQAINDYDWGYAEAMQDMMEQ